MAKKKIKAGTWEKITKRLTDEIAVLDEKVEDLIAQQDKLGDEEHILRHERINKNNILQSIIALEKAGMRLQDVN